MLGTAVKAIWDGVLSFVGAIPPSFLICIACALGFFCWGLEVGASRANQQVIAESARQIAANDAANEKSLKMLDTKYAAQAKAGAQISAQLELTQRALAAQNAAILDRIKANAQDLPECRVSAELMRLLNTGIAQADPPGPAQGAMPAATGSDAASGGAAGLP